MKRSCLIALIVCAACADKQLSQPSKNHFSDENNRKIADLQDRRKTDSLVSFLYSDKDEYRRAAALALGSVQDTTALDTLGKIATSDLETRLNAAFALGQLNKANAMQWLMHGEFGDEPEVQREIAEAMGKVIEKKDLSKFSSESDGLAWGVYRAGLRGILDSTTTNIALSKVSSSLGAAHYFSRSAFISTPEIAKTLTNASTNPDPEIRMAVVNALAKIKPEESLPAIIKATDDTDYRVRVSAARALRTQPWAKSKPLFEKLLNDENVHVNVAAAEVILNLEKKDAATISQWAKSARNWRAQATLYESAPTNGDEIKTQFNNSTNPYQQAALLTALSRTDNADFIFQQFQNSKVKVVKSTAAAGLVRINRRSPKQSSKFVEMYKHIIIDGDQGAIIPICDAFQDSTLGFKKLLTDVYFLETAKSKLSLPRDYETYVPLDQALSYLRDLPEPAPLKNEFNHPIDWKLAATINKDQKVTIETSKGTIVMQLFIEEAPGSVVNFVKLVNDKYFDGKYFHRVVPNFVIQTGCNRGDGYGSEDYSIRSEFSRRKYKTGSVGMASAGKDTEGTQWFITHSPTPHLDGKYTIFAEVIEGMDVVHKIEVGDQIISAHLAD